MEEFKVSCPQDLPGVEIWSVKDFSRPCRVFHETYTVCSLVRGAAEWRYRGGTFFSTDQNLMIMEPGELHVTDRIYKLGTYFVLFMKPSLVDELAREAGVRKTVHLRRPGVDDVMAFRLFEKFHRSLEASEDSLKEESLLVQGIQFLVDKCSETPLSVKGGFSPKALLRARDFLLENWRGKLTLRQLSMASGLSRFHFLRAFSHHFGMPPHAYQRRVRVAKALELMKKGFLPGSLDLGFSDQSHFIRHFKEIVGVTPGRYAQMVRKPFSGAIIAA